MPQRVVSAVIDRRLARVGSPAGDDDLLEAIETQIIPKLALVHRQPDLGSCGDDHKPPGEAESRALAELAVQGDHPGMLALVEQLCRDGYSFDSVLLEVIPRAARLLGADWKSDTKSFVEVTTGLGALQALISAFRPNLERGSGKGLVVLVPAWGEQHLLALYLCAQYLRRNGWVAMTAPNLAPAELNELVAVEPVTAVGVSVSDARLFRSVGNLIDGVRRHSQNRNVRFILGGSAPKLDELAHQHGATYATDAVECLQVLEKLG